MKTVPAAVRSSPGGRRPKGNFAKLDSRWSQVVPMPSHIIPECIPAQIHAKGAAEVAFHRCENAVKTHLRTHPPVRPGVSSPPRGGDDPPGAGADGGVRPEMGLHSVFTPVKCGPGCPFGMDLGWGALRDGV